MHLLLAEMRFVQLDRNVRKASVNHLKAKTFVRRKVSLKVSTTLISVVNIRRANVKRKVTNV